MKIQILQGYVCQFSNFAGVYICIDPHLICCLTEDSAISFLHLLLSVINFSEKVIIHFYSPRTSIFFSGYFVEADLYVKD